MPLFWLLAEVNNTVGLVALLVPELLPPLAEAKILSILVKAELLVLLELLVLFENNASALFAELL